MGYEFPCDPNIFAETNIWLAWGGSIILRFVTGDGFLQRLAWSRVEYGGFLGDCNMGKYIIDDPQYLDLHLSTLSMTLELQGSGRSYIFIASSHWPNFCPGNVILILKSYIYIYTHPIGIFYENMYILYWCRIFLNNLHIYIYICIYIVCTSTLRLKDTSSIRDWVRWSQRRSDAAWS